MVVRVKGCWGEVYCGLTPERGGKNGLRSEERREERSSKEGRKEE